MICWTIFRKSTCVSTMWMECVRKIGWKTENENNPSIEFQWLCHCSTYVDTPVNIWVIWKSKVMLACHLLSETRVCEISTNLSVDWRGCSKVVLSFVVESVEMTKLKFNFIQNVILYTGWHAYVYSYSAIKSQKSLTE